eukprot:scaffold2663_cov256-Pinguiococcus_pyrenoidosus.AAC.17
MSSKCFSKASLLRQVTGQISRLPPTGGVSRYTFAEKRPLPATQGEMSSTWQKPCSHLVGPCMTRGRPARNGLPSCLQTFAPAGHASSSSSRSLSSGDKIAPSSPRSILITSRLVAKYSSLVGTMSPSEWSVSEIWCERALPRKLSGMPV